MRWGERATAATILGSLLFAAQPRLTGSQTQERCTLAVSVSDSSMHTGLPHALVSYAGLDSGYRLTDASGNIRVEDVSCGYYSLSVSKPGFISGAKQAAWRNVLLNPGTRAEFDAEFAGLSQRTFIPVQEHINLTAGSSSVSVVLLPLASIGGAVLDENGEPLTGISVQGIAVKGSFTGVDYILAQTARTDDRGHYTLFNLVPGDYVVRLAGRASSIGFGSETAPDLGDRHRSMPPVYYPGTDTISAAAVLHLDPGARASADFHHPTQPAVSIDGILAGFVSNASVKMELYSDGDKIPVSSVSVNVSSGRFRLPDVPAGRYTLRVLQYQRDPPQWLAAEAPLVVGSESIHDFVILVSRGANIPVSVSYEAGAGDEPVQVVLQPQHSPGAKHQLVVGNSSSPQNPVEASLRTGSPQRSTLTNVTPGQYRLYVTLSDQSRNYAASATFENMDALHNELRLGNRGGELHVIIRGDGAYLEGQVNFQGQPAEATIYLIPAEQGLDPVKLSASDKQGRFRILGIPPGKFRVRAWVGSPTVEDLLSPGGELLTLQPGEHRTAILEAARSRETEPGEQ